MRTLEETVQELTQPYWYTHRLTDGDQITGLYEQPRLTRLKLEATQRTSGGQGSNAFGARMELRFEVLDLWHRIRAEINDAAQLIGVPRSADPLDTLTTWWNIVKQKLTDSFEDEWVPKLTQWQRDIDHCLSAPTVLEVDQAACPYCGQRRIIIDGNEVTAVRAEYHRDTDTFRVVCRNPLCKAEAKGIHAVREWAYDIETRTAKNTA